MRRHSTATLMGLTKRELVEYVRMAEHNQEVAEETLNQQAENVKDWIPVVRCKDCDFACEGSSGLVCTAWGARTDYDMFCGNGERREGE